MPRSSDQLGRPGAARDQPRPELWRRLLAAVCALAAAAVAFTEGASGLPGMETSALVPTAFREHSVALRSFVSEHPKSVEEALRVNDVARARAAARDVLRHSPLDSSALLVLAMVANQEGEAGARKTIDNLLDRVSKRDSGGQMWLAERALLERDFRGAMLHINRALKTRPEMAAQIFPALTQVIKDPEIRSQLGGELTASVPWRADFLSYATTDPGLAVPLAELYLQMPKLAASPAAETASAQLAKALAEAGQLALLRRIYPLLPSTDGKATAVGGESGFYRLSGYPPINWEIPVTANMGAAVSRQTLTSGLDIEAWADSGYDGVVARKLLWLAPGAWSLAWGRQTPQLGSGGAAYWEVDCIAGQHKEKLAQSPSLSQNAPRGALAFNVGKACDGIVLQLEIDGGDTQASRLELTNVRLQPAVRKTELP